MTSWRVAVDNGQVQVLVIFTSDLWHIVCITGECLAPTALALTERETIMKTAQQRRLSLIRACFARQTVDMELDALEDDRELALDACEYVEEIRSPLDFSSAGVIS